MFNLLEIEEHKVSRDLKGYSFMFYGLPKKGKTSLAAKFPRTLLIGFERGWNAIPGVRAIPVDKWGDFKKIVKELAKDEVRAEYDNIIIDTVDIAFAACEQFIFAREGVDGYSKIPFGGGYAMVEKEFDVPFRQIQNMGYGLITISHAKEKVQNADTPAEHTKNMPTVPKKGFEVISKLTDMICYIDSMDLPIDPAAPEKGTREERFIFMRDTKNYFAGSRFKYMQPVVKLGFEHLVDAISLAIDKEQEEYGSALFTDSQDMSKQAAINSVKTFEEVISDFDAITKELTQKGVTAPTIIDVVERHLGKGKKVSQCTPDQQSFVELIIDDFKDMLNALALK